jgi:hypothetical protein
MQFVGTPCNLIMEGEETLGEEVSEEKCLCDELMIAKHFLCVLDSIFSIIDMILSFINRETKLFFFRLEDESLLVKMLLNKQEAHNIKERVVGSASKDGQEEV